MANDDAIKGISPHPLLGHDHQMGSEEHDAEQVEVATMVCHDDGWASEIFSVPMNTQGYAWQQPQHATRHALNQAMEPQPLGILRRKKRKP